MDWDAAYANAPFIADAETYPDRWRAAAAAFRSDMGDRAVLDIPYGAGERERLDLFHPPGPAEGLVVFVHGGYWKAFGKDDWSHLAAGPVARGWAVAMAGYTLCPEVRIGAITRQIGTAVACAAERVPGLLRLAGHSAGGHLVARMVCRDAPLAAECQRRIDRVLAISALADLRPLLRTRMAGDLRLDPEEARAESPALADPMPGIPVLCHVGADERPEFRRQSALLAMIWAGLGVPTRTVEHPDRHHFDIIDGLASADGPLTGALLDPI